MSFYKWLDKEGLCHGTHSPAEVKKGASAICSECRQVFSYDKLATGSLGKSIPKHAKDSEL